MGVGWTRSNERGEIVELNEAAQRMLDTSQAPPFLPDRALWAILREAYVCPAGTVRQWTNPATGQRFRLAVTEPPGAVVWVEDARTVREVSSDPRREELIVALFRESPVGMALFDRELRFVEINEAMGGLNGLSPETHVGKHLSEMLPASSVSFIEPIMRRVLETGRAVQAVDVIGEDAMTGNSGAWLAYYHPIRDRASNVVGLAASVLEISDKVRNHVALRRSEERLRMLVESTAAVMWTLDGRGRMTLPGPAWSDYTGQSDDEAHDGGWFSAIHAEERAGFVESFSERVEEAGAGMWTIRVWHQRSKRHRWVELRIAPVLSPIGTPLEFSAMLNDIDERQSLLEERERLLAMERSARQEAERASRVKDEFVAVLSHELRTPLTAILGWTEVLGSPNCTSEMHQAGLDEIASAVRRQTQMIEDLLDLSRIVVGRLRLDQQYVDLAKVALDAATALAPQAEQKGVELIVDLEHAEASIIWADPDRMQQVLTNLLTNALKFTPSDGSITIEVVNENDLAVVHVKDTGEGVEPAFIPHMFEQFRQGHGALTRKHGGLGLGLSIVKRLVELHGGEVSASSPGKNQGATLTVRLPLAEHGQARLTQQPQAQGTSDRRLIGKRVLVVDDDPATLTVLSLMLEAEGATVTRASSAPEGFEALRSQQPDVLLSDISMPDEDGYSLVRKVRALPYELGGGTPALAVTAFAKPDDRERARKAGFDGHISKPVRTADLVRHIFDALDARHPRA